MITDSFRLNLPTTNEIKAASACLIDIPQNNVIRCAIPIHLRERFRQYQENNFEGYQKDVFEAEVYLQDALTGSNSMLQLKNCFKDNLEKRDKKEIMNTVINVKEPHGSWQAIVDEYKCLICQDILAAPVAIKCGHSYCGICIKDLCPVISSSPPSRSSLEIFMSWFRFFPNQVNQDGIIAPLCPHCRDPFEGNGNYEMFLDKLILQKVNDTCDIDPITHLDCSEKKESYHYRRNQYLAKRKRVPVVPVESASHDNKEADDGHKWVPYLVFVILVALVLAK
mmetsp:Transcript_9606/g.14344  ORF Transcript_9606/g.14344 Transcript_9606/m.14344 type:complete len:281 (-) Transcript_9606:159-1001(-)